ncbi:transposable element Tc1 transposase [Trichonephila clavipes]|nr:transposable element Tc1 transposase [Trichonephila clavipes]
MTIQRRLIERNLCSYRPLRNLPLTLTHCRARLQGCLARSGWNHADWERIVFSDESRILLCPDDHRRRVWRRPEKRADPAFAISRHTDPQPGVMYDNARPHMACVAIKYLTANQILPWPVRSPDLSAIEHVWDMMRRRLHLPGNADDLVTNLYGTLSLTF